MINKPVHFIEKVNIKDDAIDEYFECITACSLADDGMHCFTQCIDIHLKKEEEQ